MTRLPIRRLLAPHWAILALVASLAVGLGPLAGATASDQEDKTVLRGGYDFFATDRKATSFTFSGEFALPRGFFDQDSARFEGRVNFKGVPLRTFKGQNTGNADTVIERKSMPALRAPFPSRGNAEVEMVALSLESVKPLSVKVGGRTEEWDVKFRVSSARPSLGKMTIVQRHERGGVFNTELTVFGAFTFTRRSDGAERALDLGSKELGKSGVLAITLRANDIPWSTKPPKGALVVEGLSDGFSAGVQGTQAVQIDDQHSKSIHRFKLAIPQDAL